MFKSSLICRQVFLVTSLSLILVFFKTTKVASEAIAIGQNFQPISVRGQTGGTVNTRDCGFISQKPNHVLTVPQRINYLRISVQAGGGQPTLLIQGPGKKNRFCILGDRLSGFNPEISGVWEPGRYLIYVGDRTGARYPFRMNLSTN